MKFYPLPIEGAYIVGQEPHGDDRGFFARAYCQREFDGAGLRPTFVQANNSLSTTVGTLRGLHYQLGRFAEDKLIRPIHGAIFDVLVDLRPDSPTFLKHHTFELSSADRVAVYVPRGCANGIETLQPDTELFYLASNFYEPSAERGLRWNDPRFGISWPLQPVVLSPKDASHPDFNEAYHLDPSFGPFRVKAVVTGATGFVGSRLVRRLIDDGNSVGILAREGSSHAELAGYLERVRTHIVDLSPESVQRAIAAEGPDVVFYLATYYARDHRPEDLAPMLEANVAFPLRVVDAMAREGVKNLVNAGSAWQYFESEAYRPVCLHSATKQAFESLLAYFIDADNIRCITLMVHDTYGPSDPRRKIFSILRERAANPEPLDMSGGEQLIDLVHVDDVVSAFVIAARRLLGGETRVNEEIYSVTSGEPRPLRTIVETYLRLAESKVAVRWGARPYHRREVMTPWRAGKTLPGWHPQVDLETGLRQLVGDRLPS